MKLIEEFLSGMMDSSRFEKRYLEAFKRDPTFFPEEIFETLDALFAEVDAFCPDPEIRGPNGLDEIQLRAKCLQALQRLRQLGYSS
jgi:hypothetical protein